MKLFGARKCPGIPVTRLGAKRWRVTREPHVAKRDFFISKRLMQRRLKKVVMVHAFRERISDKDNRLSLPRLDGQRSYRGFTINWFWLEIFWALLITLLRLLVSQSRDYLRRRIGVTILCKRLA